MQAGSKPGTAATGIRAQTAGSTGGGGLAVSGGFEAGAKPGTAGSAMMVRAGTAGTVSGGQLQASPNGDPNAAQVGSGQQVQTHLEELQKKYRALDMARRLYAGTFDPPPLHGARFDSISPLMNGVFCLFAIDLLYAARYRFIRWIGLRLW